MFIYDFIQVDVPFGVVREHLQHGAGAWLSRLASAACEGERYPAERIGVRATGDIPITKDVMVEVDVPYENDGLVRVPFRWRATGPSGLFPALDGDIELARLDHDRTHICVMGRYDAPLGRSVGCSTASSSTTSPRGRSGRSSWGWPRISQALLRSAGQPTDRRLRGAGHELADLAHGHGHLAQRVLPAVAAREVRSQPAQDLIVRQATEDQHGEEMHDPGTEVRLASDC